MSAYGNRLFAHLRPLRQCQISSREATRLVDRYALSTPYGAWHFSWDIERFFHRMSLHETRDHIYIFNPAPIHQWAPAPLFSNDSALDRMIVAKGKDCPYWMLKLTTFDDFLARRTASSGQPGAHFPTTKTYPQVASRVDCRVEHFPLIGNDQRFMDWYDALKDPKYAHTGARCLTNAFAVNAAAPREWFSFYALLENGTDACKAVNLVVSDSRSSSGINAAAGRKSGVGYGIFLLVEIVRHLCEKGMYSFDGGVSESYGGYKEKVFLDWMQTDSGEIRTASGLRLPLSC